MMPCRVRSHLRPPQRLRRTVPTGLGGIAAHPVPDQQNPKAAPGLGRQLQTPPRGQAKRFLRLGHHRRHLPAAQGLFNRPQQIHLAARADQMQPLSHSARHPPEHRDFRHMGRLHPHQRAFQPRQMQQRKQPPPGSFRLMHAGRHKPPWHRCRPVKPHRFAPFADPGRLGPCIKQRTLREQTAYEKPYRARPQERPRTSETPQARSATNQNLRPPDQHNTGPQRGAHQASSIHKYPKKPKPRSATPGANPCPENGPLCRKTAALL